MFVEEVQMVKRWCRSYKVVQIVKRWRRWFRGGTDGLELVQMV